MIKLNAIVIWNSIDDFAKLCDGVMLGKRFVIEGVFGKGAMAQSIKRQDFIRKSFVRL